MFYLLHHSTGALMLDADNREEAVSWSERQLGNKATATSIIEFDDNSSNEWVEKSGTGIFHASAEACEPKLSFMADSVQRVVGLDREVVHSFDWYRATSLRQSNATVH